MTKRINLVKRSIKQALHETEIYAARDYGMAEREYMRILVETVEEIAKEYVTINSQMIETYDPQHVQKCANSLDYRLDIDDEQTFFTGS